MKYRHKITSKSVIQNHFGSIKNIIPLNFLEAFLKLKLKPLFFEPIGSRKVKNQKRSLWNQTCFSFLEPSVFYRGTFEVSWEENLEPRMVLFS